MKRRHFFKVSSLAGGGLLLSTLIPYGCQGLPEETVPDWEPNFYLRISPDNRVTFICSRAEMGQGTSTGLSMIAADELGVSLEDLTIEFADGNAQRYGDLQDTGGSNGLRMLWDPLREAAATAREILKEAAAQKWGVSREGLVAENAGIINPDTGSSFTFGELLPLAATLPAPREIVLKDRSEYRYIGQPISGNKNQLIVRGQQDYSINVQLPEMLYAVIERCPYWKGSVQTYNADAARAIPGVVEVIEMDGSEVDPSFDYKGGVRPGVAVLAENTWAAMQGKKALEVSWEPGPNAERSDTDLIRELAENKAKSRESSFELENGAGEFRKGVSKIRAVYESPFQVNACMEPLNAVAYHKGHQLEVWVGSQAPSLNREYLSEYTGLPEAAIQIHNHPMGGGFGRRFFCDYIEEAVFLSEKVRRPVKVMWTREDTFTTSKYHPFRTEHWEAALDQNGQPLALAYHGVVSRPQGYRPFPYGIPMVFHPFIPYQKGNLLPRASWRSVFAHPWGLSRESFIDEVAHAAGMDPVQFRFRLLEQAQPVIAQKSLPWVGDDLYVQRLKRTLELAVEHSGYGQTRNDGIFQGVSAICYNTTYCSQVADVSVGADGKVKVHKVTAVIDCGLAVNPSQVKAQIEGSIIWGLSAVLKGPITVKNGLVQERNYDTYDLLRMAETPEIEVHIVESEEAPTGTGEPAVPGLAPAVLNAVFAATGKRIRKIPISTEDLMA